ncbi:MAG: DUF805 domain-containing protein [Candidatus Obscuribacterales bacterium]|jgi:uncharacterized membrane protein YhaH (DUF805 family)|nr:DUF805 domain-containing protein [Candidatus Obscuribacterales bacterium]
MINEVKTNYVRVLTTKYASFDGRASRKEFWMFMLAQFCISFIINLAIIGLWTATAINLSVISTIYALATLVPGLAIAVRRLHDSNRTGWWELMGFVPVVGALTLVVFYCLPGTADENKFGSKPKGIGNEADQTLEGAEQDLENIVNKMRQACVESLAAEKLTEMELNKKVQERDKWETRAGQAVNQNNDELARQCLAKKLEANLAIQVLTAQLKTEKEANATLKTKYAEMQEQLQQFRLRKSNVEAREKAASASAASTKNSASGAMDRFEQAEEKFRHKEAMNQAMSDVSTSTADKSYCSDLEDELEAIKKSLAGKQQDS